MSDEDFENSEGVNPYIDDVFSPTRTNLVGSGSITVVVNEKNKSEHNFDEQNPNFANYVASLDIQDAEKKRLKKYAQYEFKRPLEVYFSKKSNKEYLPWLYPLHKQKQGESKNFQPMSSDPI